ncbi:MAG TPA: hypothetical protein VH575_23410 [Gemmataceae bacterium]|jgi:hypothetical protein
MSQARRLGAVLLLCLPGLGAAPAPVLLPSGIADADGHVGYFASANDSIEAIDLASGKVLWQTHEAQRPLLVDGEHLLAQAGVKRNRLRILRLDRTNGECDLESDSVVFPAWVVTGEAHGHSFSAHWRLGKHQLILDWEASAWHVGKPTPQEEEAARKHASGVFAVDLRTGQIEVRPVEKTDAPPPPALPEHLENKPLRWQGQVGPHRKVLVLEERNGQQHFVLHSWDPQKEKEQEAQELLRGKRLVVRVTLDERVLWLREAGSSADEGNSLMPRKEPSWWQLFSVETGKRLGRVRDEAGMNTFVVLGKRVFYLVPGPMHGSLDRPNIQPRILKAIDLSSGKKLWERPIAGKLLTPPPL